MEPNHRQDCIHTPERIVLFIRRNLAELESFGVFNPTIIQSIKSASSELKANANVQLLPALRGVEFRDTTRFGGVRKKK